MLYVQLPVTEFDREDEDKYVRSKHVAVESFKGYAV